MCECSETSSKASGGHAHEFRGIASRETAAASTPAPAERPPALFLKNDTFPELSGPWTELEDDRAQIVSKAKSVGRIHHESVTLGTGFLIGPDVVMTNRHVAESFSMSIDGTLKIRVGWEPAIDFIAQEAPPPDGEPGDAEDRRDGRTDHERKFHVGPAACFRIVHVLYVDQRFDLALLRISWDPLSSHPKGKGWERPNPLTVATTAPSAAPNLVYLIGCPDQDPWASREELSGVFQNQFDVKRLQPGHLTHVAMYECALGHDCSTLKGNSGSCIIDRRTGDVIGLHVAGSREAPGQPSLNGAIALWLLADSHRALFAMAKEPARPTSQPQAETAAVSAAI